MMEAARIAGGRGALVPAETPAGAEADVAAFLVVPSWGEADTPATVAARLLAEVYGLNVAEHPATWTRYTEAARAVGCRGRGAVPAMVGGPGTCYAA